MIQKIPKDQYKTESIGDEIIVTGFKSRVYKYENGFTKPPVVDPAYTVLTFATKNAGHTKFELCIRGREEMEAVKSVIEFALEPKEGSVG
jgi:hypothetical protein